MRILKKNPNKDFIILNLTDPQLGDPEWEDGHVNRRIVEHTITQLVEKVQPDLITVSGDLAWAGYDHAYQMFGSLIESFQIPWTVVWGNHDNQNGAEYIEKLANMYMQFPHCLYEKGDSALGNGNYVIVIEENEKPVEALIMMDTHNQDDYVDAEGNTQRVWSKLTPAQIEWYKEQVRGLKEMGCKDSSVILHIPIHAYSLASAAAYKTDVKLNELTLEQSYGKECWNEGYEDSVGVQYEGIACYPDDEGMFAAIKEMDNTKLVIAGHDHVNNWMIRYEGVLLVYGLKVGPGCYWNSRLNGGTVLKINENGVFEVSHEYVDVSKIME